ncbi:hypothetical protein FLAG1_09137 [Fusarium langsethiae]|uniref:Uncharacterized protein n=1 Tax=Fusarium langsethiae TaxID=179993 RepID=A0A0M9EQW2_FUSLA|nr:hypothetical protein FLAG1_09137 [Fusarium langsethiae]
MNLLYHGIVTLAFTRLAMANVAPQKTSDGLPKELSKTLTPNSPGITAPPIIYAERDLESVLSSLGRLADKASEKGGSFLDEGETLIKDKASAIRTAVDGKETLVSDKLDEIHSRVMSAMAEAVTNLNEEADDYNNNGASLSVYRSAATASAFLGAILICFLMT